MPSIATNSLLSTLASPTMQRALYALCFCLGLGWSVPGSAESGENQQKLKELLKEIERVKVVIEKKSTRQGAVEKAMAAAEIRVGELHQEQRQLMQRKRKLDLSLAELESQRNVLQAQVSQQKSLISQQLVSRYKSGEQNPIQLLLENGNPADIDRQLDYLARINTARHTLLKDYRDLLQLQQQNAESLQTQQQALEETLAALEQRRIQLASAQSERSAKLAQLSQEIGDGQARIDKLQRDREALQTLIKEMSQAAALRAAPAGAFELPAHIDGFADARGQLPWPVAGKSRNNTDKQWQGVTISAKKGSAVQAIFPGRVVFADWFRGQGLLMIVDHGDNYWSLYGHNESLMKSPGDTVVAGEPIATVGDSGGQSQSALYFEIRHQGKPLKPGQWCKS